MVDDVIASHPREIQHSWVEAVVVASTAQGSDDASYTLDFTYRRSGRVAEGAPLLREYTLIAYRGFESLLLRHLD